VDYLQNELFLYNFLIQLPTYIIASTEWEGISLFNTNYFLVRRVGSDTTTNISEDTTNISENAISGYTNFLSMSIIACLIVGLIMIRKHSFKDQTQRN